MASPRMMRFRLSTLLLLMLVSSIALGWYTNQSRLLKRGIVGHWYLALRTKELIMMTNPHEHLEMRNDGTFALSTRRGPNTPDRPPGNYGDYAGTYSCGPHGRVRFQVTNRTLLDQPPEKIDQRFDCVCTFDGENYMFIDPNEHSNSPFRGTYLRASD